MKLMATLAGGLAAALFSLSAAAQAGPAVPAPVAQEKPAVTGDCARARDPQRCQAFQQAKLTCQGKRGAQRRQCLEDNMPPPDCSKMRYPERCEAMQAAKEACKDRNGKERRQCIKQQMKAVLKVK